MRFGGRDGPAFGRGRFASIRVAESDRSPLTGDGPRMSTCDVPGGLGVVEGVATLSCNAIREVSQTIVLWALWATVSLHDRVGRLP